MEYDPVKDKLQTILGRSPVARRLFFGALDRLFLRSRYVRREISRLKASGFNPEQVLDAGSGFGQYSFRLARTFPGAKIIGLDVKADLVDSCNDFAKQAGLSPPDRIHFVVGDLLNLTYILQFDLVLAVDVMEHIEDDVRVFVNFGQALKPGGIFIMTTPYFDGENASLRADAPFVDEHVRPGYSKSELEQKLAQAGMTLERFTITYGPWGEAAWRLLQQWPMRWLAGRIWLLPLAALYLGIAYPAARVFMQLDMAAENPRGGGLLAVARKSWKSSSEQLSADL